MRLFIAIFFAWGILAGTGSEAPDSSSASSTSTVAPYQFLEDSEMTVHGSSNVRDWTMDVAEINGQIDLESTEEGAPAIHSIRIEVPVEQIVSDRSSMEDKAHKALKKNAYPVIYFQSEDVEVTPSEMPARTEAGSSEDSSAEDGSFTATATGELIIAGERRTVKLSATGTRLEDGSYRMEGKHELRLSEFEVDRPTAMLGALRVADEIRLTFTAIVAPK